MGSRRRAEKAAEEIGACLEPATGSPELRGAYAVLKKWYRHTSTRAPNPSRADITKVTGYYAALHCQEELTTPRIPVPTHVTPFRVNGNLPSEEEVKAAVQLLRLHKAVGHNHPHTEIF